MQVTGSTAPPVAGLVTHIETNIGIYIRATAASKEPNKGGNSREDNSDHPSYC